MTNSEMGSPAREQESQVALIVGLSLALVALSSISVALRLYTRKRILRLVAAEDYVIVAAQTLAIGVAIITIIQVVWGHLGQHAEFATAGELVIFAKTLLAVIIVYNTAQILTKISFLLQYRRLFPGSIIQAICKWGIVFLIAWGIAQQIYTPFSCIPLKLILPDTKICYDDAISFQLNAVMNVLTDIVVFIIPIAPVLKLHVNAQRKAYLIAVFCFGFVACAISAIRLHEMRRTLDRGDSTWDISATAYYSTVELGIGILCACVPTLRPLLRKISPALIGSTSQGTSDHRLNTLKSRNKTKKIASGGSGIYIQNCIEFHSTTELQTKPKDPYSVGGRSLEDISIEEIQPKGVTSTRSTAPHV